ncbi:hypothetical protein [Natrialba magadii]|uniref:hypothetical protein n=1 Tax=Natrialba magadii TaxID=13769 RepID=UPI0011D13A66|nr:hypothetical protein [Natrialba magadii]
MPYYRRGLAVGLVFVIAGVVGTVVFGQFIESRQGSQVAAVLFAGAVTYLIMISLERMGILTPVRRNNGS